MGNENIIEKDMSAMAKDLFDIAISRNPKVVSVSATYTRHNPVCPDDSGYDYISVRATDANGNIIANLNRCMDLKEE